jgi:Uma2 family endonuclease
MTAYSPDLKPLLNLTTEQFYKLCQANPDIKFERNRRGHLIVMAPTGGGTGYLRSCTNLDKADQALI